MADSTKKPNSETNDTSKKDAPNSGDADRLKKVAPTSETNDTSKNEAPNSEEADRLKKVTSTSETNDASKKDAPNSGDADRLKKVAPNSETNEDSKKDTPNSEEADRLKEMAPNSETNEDSKKDTPNSEDADRLKKMAPNSETNEDSKKDTPNSEDADRLKKMAPNSETNEDSKKDTPNSEDADRLKKMAPNSETNEDSKKDTPNSEDADRLKKMAPNSETNEDSKKDTPNSEDADRLKKMAPNSETNEDSKKDTPNSEDADRLKEMAPNSETNEDSKKDTPNSEDADRLKKMAPNSETNEDSKKDTPNSEEADRLKEMAPNSETNEDSKKDTPNSEDADRLKKMAPNSETNEDSKKDTPNSEEADRLKEMAPNSETNEDSKKDTPNSEEADRLKEMAPTSETNDTSKKEAPNSEDADRLKEMAPTSETNDASKKDAPNSGDADRLKSQGPDLSLLEKAIDEWDQMYDEIPEHQRTEQYLNEQIQSLNSIVTTFEKEKTLFYQCWERMTPILIIFKIFSDWKLFSNNLYGSLQIVSWACENGIKYNMNISEIFKKHPVSKIHFGRGIPNLVKAKSEEQLEIFFSLCQFVSRSGDGMKELVFSGFFDAVQRMTLINNDSKIWNRAKFKFQVLVKTIKKDPDFMTVAKDYLQKNLAKKQIRRGDKKQGNFSWSSMGCYMMSILELIVRIPPLKSLIANNDMENRGSDIITKILQHSVKIVTENNDVMLKTGAIIELLSFEVYNNLTIGAFHGGDSLQLLKHVISCHPALQDLFYHSFDVNGKSEAGEVWEGSSITVRRLEKHMSGYYFIERKVPTCGKYLLVSFLKPFVIEPIMLDVDDRTIRYNCVAFNVKSREERTMHSNLYIRERGSDGSDSWNIVSSGTSKPVDFTTVSQCNWAVFVRND
ncbi:unnamed protein product [Caenorhabditis brenneri]